MEYHQREYPLFSACGLNCGLCSRYQMDGASKCPGCCGKDFLTKHPVCGLLSCTQRKGIEYCYECNEFPCKKYDGADQSDSFITHLHQISDLNKAKSLGIDAYKEELNEKVEILEHLLANYNDGRRKSLFCIATNLLEIEDLRNIVRQIKAEAQADMPPKEKAAIAVRLLQEIAGQRNISLKLRKK